MSLVYTCACHRLFVVDMSSVLLYNESKVLHHRTFDVRTNHTARLFSKSVLTFILLSLQGTHTVLA